MSSNVYIKKDLLQPSVLLLCEMLISNNFCACVGYLSLTNFKGLAWSGHLIMVDQARSIYAHSGRASCSLACGARSVQNHVGGEQYVAILREADYYYAYTVRCDFRC